MEHTISIFNMCLKNEDMYYTVSYIRVKIVVGKAKAEGCETFDYLEGETGDKIGDIALPEAEGGTYQWKTLQSTVVVSGNEYEVVFKPADMTNYDWSDVPDTATHIRVLYLRLL